ncbi:hypothetical protein TNCV_1486121 [Trichonephila clavipes]|nr:hypothetical protein TNCV_1486121 [Trichonephila clavipes]
MCPLLVLASFESKRGEVVAQRAWSRTRHILSSSLNVTEDQGRSYRRINDTGPPICVTSPTNRAPYLKRGIEEILIQGLLRDASAEDHR